MSVLSKRALRGFAAFLILSLVTGLAASAQTHYKPHISVGIKGGMTLSEMSFSPSVKQKWNDGTAGALTFRYTEEKLFGLIAELGWTQILKRFVMKCLRNIESSEFSSFGI